MINREDVARVLQAESILIDNIYRNGMTPDDFSNEDFLNDVTEIVNNDNYRRELIEENELG